MADVWEIALKGPSIVQKCITTIHGRACFYTGLEESRRLCMCLCWRVPTVKKNECMSDAKTCSISRHAADSTAEYLRLEHALLDTADDTESLCLWQKYAQTDLFLSLNLALIVFLLLCHWQSTTERKCCDAKIGRHQEHLVSLR